MLHNAFAYVTRKFFKSIVIFLIILLMASLSLVGLSIKGATAKASQETFKNITNSFSMQINRRVNQGTPRGAGNIKGEDIKKITENKAIESYVKRINAIGDLTGYELIETPETKKNLTPDRAKHFGSSLMITGVNDSSKEDKFVSGSYKLVEGEHLTNDDKDKILMHKDLAAKHGWKVGDKVKLDSNIYDADNEKGAKETVEVTIKGLFDGHNKSAVTYSQELYENTAITDIHTAAKLYGYTEETAIYQDATFFVNGNKNIDDVMKKLQRLDINWKSYNLIKSSSNYPGLQQSISGIYGIADKLLMGSLIFSGLVLTLLLFLWINARRKEIGIMLSLGKTKVDIIGQFILELIIISVLAFTGAYFAANYTAKGVSDNILTNINSEITKKSEKEGKSSNVGGGAEVDGFNRTLTKLNVKINVQDVIYVGILCTIIILIALGVASYKIM